MGSVGSSSHSRPILCSRLAFAVAWPPSRRAAPSLARHRPRWRGPPPHHAAGGSDQRRGVRRRGHQQRSGRRAGRFGTGAGADRRPARRGAFPMGGSQPPRRRGVLVPVASAPGRRAAGEPLVRDTARPPLRLPPRHGAAGPVPAQHRPGLLALARRLPHELQLPGAVLGRLHRQPAGAGRRLLPRHGVLAADRAQDRARLLRLPRGASSSSPATRSRRTTTRWASCRWAAWPT